MVKALRITIFVVFCLLLSSGCTDQEVQKKWQASCTAFVADLPEEFAQLPAALREELEFHVTLSCPAADERYTITLSERNGFQERLFLRPGSYQVGEVYVKNQDLVMLRAVTKTDTIELSKNINAELPVLVKEPQTFIDWVHSNTPQDAILSAAPFSRTIQYAGQILGLNMIRQKIKFLIPDDRLLSRGERYFAPAEDEKAGVSLILQNKTDASIHANKADCIGVRFFKNNVVFPRGVTLGMAISDIVHTEKGAWGTPTYALGTPLIGMGYAETTLVYLDTESGDRISLELDPSDTLIRGITYEFAQYQ